MLSATDLLFGENNEKPLFDDRKQIKSWIQKRLLPLGILIVIERSDDTKIVFKCKSYRYSSAFKKVRQKRISKKQKLFLQKQGLLDSFEMEQKLKQKKMKNSGCSCPFRIRANFSIRSNKWSIVIVNGHHNHPLKNCLSENGDSFNDEFFNHDIHANLVKNRFHANPAEPQMVEDLDDADSASCFRKMSTTSSTPNAATTNFPAASSPIDNLPLSRVSSNEATNMLDRIHSSTPNSPSFVSSEQNLSKFYNSQNSSTKHLSIHHRSTHPTSQVTQKYAQQQFAHDYGHFSLSSKLCVASSENSVDDFLSTQSLPHLSYDNNNSKDSKNSEDLPISYDFGDLDPSSAGTYDSPFLDPVRDDELNTGISTFDDMIDDFFNNGKKPQQQRPHHQSYPQPTFANASDMPSTGSHGAPPAYANVSNYSFLLDNMNMNIPTGMDQAGPSSNPHIKMEPTGLSGVYDLGFSEPQHQQGPHSGQAYEGFFMGSGNANVNNRNSSSNAIGNQEQREDFNNVPIMTFVNDCPALY